MKLLKFNIVPIIDNLLYDTIHIKRIFSSLKWHAVYKHLRWPIYNKTYYSVGYYIITKLKSNTESEGYETSRKREPIKGKFIMYLNELIFSIIAVLVALGIGAYFGGK